jgi:hypothetical protein
MAVLLVINKIYETTLNNNSHAILAIHTYQSLAQNPEVLTQYVPSSCGRFSVTTFVVFSRESWVRGLSHHPNA